MKDKWKSISLTSKIISISIALVFLSSGALMAASPFFVAEGASNTGASSTTPAISLTDNQTHSLNAQIPTGREQTASAASEPINAPVQATTITPSEPLKVDRTAYIAACENLKMAQTATYEADVNAEKSRNQTNIANIYSEYRNRGLASSGLMQDKINKENVRFNAAITTLESNHQQQIAVVCE